MPEHDHSIRLASRSGLRMAESDLRIPVIANKSYNIRMDTAAVSTHITGLDSGIGRS